MSLTGDPALEDFRTRIVLLFARGSHLWPLALPRTLALFAIPISSKIRPEELN
jgi:hypothetical protein